MDNTTNTSKNQIFNMADELKALMNEKKELEEKTKDVNSKIEEIDKNLSEAMANEELDKFTHSGNTFYLKSRLFASPIAGKKEDLIKALKDNGFGDLVVEQVNANTLSSFIKEQRESHNDSTKEDYIKDVPKYLEGIVSTFERINVGVRKA